MNIVDAMGCLSKLILIKGKAVVADALGSMNKNRYEVLDKFFNDNRPNRFGF